MVRVDALVICRDGVDIISQSNGLSSVRISLLSGKLDELNDLAIRLCGSPLRVIDLESKTIALYQGSENPSIIVWALLDKVKSTESVIEILKGLFAYFIEHHLDSLDKSITELEG